MFFAGADKKENFSSLIRFEFSSVWCIMKSGRIDAEAIPFRPVLRQSKRLPSSFRPFFLAGGKGSFLARLASRRHDIETTATLP